MSDNRIVEFIEVSDVATVSVFDVAAYILKQCGPMSHMKLQKLVYYAQAWSLVWDDKQLFREKIEAWANGPVVPELFKLLRGKFTVRQEMLNDVGNKDKLLDRHKATVVLVLDFYGKHDSQWLSDLTHMELPWRKAREGMPPGKRGSKEITLASMSEYYSSL